MRNAIIAGIGAYAPERVVPNTYFNELLGEDVDSWLRENVQIYERRWCAPDESTADLCERAARLALERADLPADALDLIIVATDTPEFISPSTASVLQDRLAAKNAGTFDVNTACAGFVTALDIGSKYLRADEQYRYVLVVGAYAMSKYLNPKDKKTVTLFADGAGAVVLQAAAEDRGVLATKLVSEGQYNEWMGIYAGGAHKPVDTGVLERHEHQLQFVRKFPKELNPDIWTSMALDLCSRLAILPEEIAHFFITQINIHSIWETMDRLGLPRDRAHTVMHYYGYTGSACIPMALNDAYEKGKLHPGQWLFFIGSGGGLAFAAAAVRF
ncbi:MAG: ketoacyl-ACP synthase III [Saprospiraceae bacterium]|nr:ketoacyl-ACP synthase III [Saprospiraceae bacterium]MCB0680223.1 ketoacyl-ACP synthase III [Saprospiraceae bacterium]